MYIEKSCMRLQLDISWNLTVSVPGLRAPLCFQWRSALRPIIFYTVGERFINTQNPTNEPRSIKTLDFRDKNSFDLRVGNRDFRQKSHENTKEFLSSNFKMSAKNYWGVVEHSIYLLLLIFYSKNIQFNCQMFNYIFNMHYVLARPFIILCSIFVIG